MQSIPNMLGLVGVAIEVLAYAMVSAGRWSSKRALYPIVNIIGTSLILYSLLFAWNLPAVVMQILWIFFSAVGLLRGIIARRRI